MQSLVYVYMHRDIGGNWDGFSIPVVPDMEMYKRVSKVELPWLGEDIKEDIGATYNACASLPYIKRKASTITKKRYRTCTSDDRNAIIPIDVKMGRWQENKNIARERDCRHFFRKWSVDKKWCVELEVH